MRGALLPTVDGPGPRVNPRRSLPSRARIPVRPAGAYLFSRIRRGIPSHRGVSIPLSDDDRALVRQTLQEIREAPAPRDRAPMGCVVALPGFVILLIFPMVARIIGAGSTLGATLIGVGIVLVVVGVAIWFGAGGFVRGHALAASEAALRTLESEEVEREVELRAATLLVARAYATYDQRTTRSFDPVEARHRLGERVELVLEVERLLVGDGSVDPVFTGETGEGG